MARRDWLLVALNAAGDSGLSPVQVQKSMFLFAKGAQRARAEEEFYNFEPYNFGPFDAAIYSDLEAMEAEGHIRIFNRNGTANRLYVVTEAGQAAAARVERREARTSGYVAEVVEWVKRKSFPELLRAIYRKWPEYKKNSIFVG